MKAKPKAIRELVLAAKAAGRSFEAVAAEFEVPLGTVKTWWSRYRKAWGKKQRESQSQNQSRLKTGAPSTEDETLGTLGKGGVDETSHRGLRACHMPGRKSSKQMTFSLFKRNLWPPAVWKVPPGLVGGELLMLLQERSCMGLVGKKGRQQK